MKLAYLDKVISGAAATLRAGQICTLPSDWVRLAMPRRAGPGEEGPGRFQQRATSELEYRSGLGAAHGGKQADSFVLRLLTG